MLDIIRESTFGEIVNRLSSGRVFRYPDQRPSFVVPEKYLAKYPQISGRGRSATLARRGSYGGLDEKDQHANCAQPPCALTTEPTNGIALEAFHRGISVPSRKLAQQSRSHHHGPLPVTPGPRIANQGSEGHKKHDSSTSDHPSQFILVEWYNDDDPENPRNWSLGKRYFVLFSVCLLTFACYTGPAIYVPSIPGLMTEFGISSVVASLGLSLYVFAYGVAPMFLSPLQELPSLGRNPVYIITLFLFAILQIPAALSTSISQLLVLRFLTGFFSSPALATGGASLADIFPPDQFVYTLGFWSMSAWLGPTLGPVTGAFAAQAKGWRWPLWELAWISGFVAIFCLVFLPETLPDTILLKRAQRLRKLTGNENLRSMSEIKQAELSASEVAREYLIRPFSLMWEPAVLFVNIYSGLAYAVFYLWFEAFPIVLGDIYHFSLGTSGLPSIGSIVGAIVSYVINAAWNYYYLSPLNARVLAEGKSHPLEKRLELALLAGTLIPVSLLVFGWTSRPSVHWILPIIGAGLYARNIHNVPKLLDVPSTGVP